MNWKISNHKFNPVILSPSLVLDPPDEVLNSFIRGVHPYRFPDLLEAATAPGTFNDEVSSFISYELMDEEDLAKSPGIEPDEVRIRNDVTGKTFVNALLFYLLLRDYAKALLVRNAGFSEIQ